MNDGDKGPYGTIQSTSKKLGVSSSHLVNFFSKEKKLLIFINAEREKLGMRSLK